MRTHRSSTRRTLVVTVTIALALALVSCKSRTEPLDSTARPAHWAEPIAGLAGLDNLHRVSETLYRGAQPKEEGFARLRSMGVKTVASLRRHHCSEEECDRNGLGYVSIPMNAWNPKREQLAAFLSVATDPHRQPVFVHCKYGADRTGLAVAVYRITVQGWSKEAAMEEMKDGGYGFHSRWHDLLEYLRDLEIEGLLEEGATGGV